ncbi:MAG: hypothetical protein ACE5H8_02525 [Alphaproteobacteria bacterium]
MMKHLQRLRFAALAVCALVLAGAPSDAAASTARGEAITGAFTGGDAGRETLYRFFTETDGSPEAIAAQAADLLGALKGDPLTITDAANRIAEAASEAMNALRMYRVALEDGFALPEGAIGWDLGTATSPLYPGFRRVTPAGLLAGPEPLRSVDAGDGDGLFSDGIHNVNGFGAIVPDGRYRLIVLTGNPDDKRGLSAPLGRELRVAARTKPIVNADRNEWIERAWLSPTGTRFADGSIPAGTVVGGATVATVEVIGGHFFIEFAPGQIRSYVSAVILEPEHKRSVLDAPPLLPAARYLAPQRAERIANAEAEIASAIGALLEKVASAAGGDAPATRLKVLDLYDAPVQDTQLVSDN